MTHADSGSGAAHRVELVRPGPASLAWLVDAVAALQAGDPLRRVSIVASPYLAAVARRALAERGCANVRAVLPRQLSTIVAGRAHNEDVAELSGVLEGAAIRQSVHSHGSGALAHVARHRGLHDGLRGLFRELRLQDAEAETLEILRQRGTVPAAAAAAYRNYLQLVAGYRDNPALARLAAERAASSGGAWVQSLGALIVYLPPRLDADTVRLLAALGRHLPVQVAVPHVGEAAADGLLHTAAARLAAQLDVPVSGTSQVSTMPTTEITVVSASDPAEEVRTAVRSVAADLEAGVPLWRIAVLYADEASYGQPVREALDTASFPWHAAAGRPLSGYWAARSLLGLLALPERHFSRDAVLEWLTSRPPVDAAADDPLPPLPVSTWDRLSRQAQVVEGARQWVDRLQRLAQVLAEAETCDANNADAVAEADDEPATGPLPIQGDAAAAAAMATAIARLSDDLAPPPDGSSWETFVAWADDLRIRYVSSGPDWPAAETAASGALGTALESLREAADLEPSADLRTFRDALAGILEIRRLPEGTLGQGVLVGPLASAVGAAFDRVYLLGLVEGALPSRPPTDPLAAEDGADDPLGRRARVREADRRAFLGALAAADGGRVTLSYARSDGGSRATFPSRWLLEQVSHLEGAPVYASDLAGVLAVGRPWLRRVASPRDGALRVAAGDLAAADLADRRLAAVAAWRRGHPDLDGQPLTARHDLPLGAALGAATARRSRRFTPYDGNLADLAGASRLMTHTFTRGRTSATAIERWATCGFLYLLRDVLRVRATRRPDDEWTASALDRGSAVHLILERFYRALAEEKRLSGEDRITQADHDRLDQVAAAVFADLEADGKTGHPLAWENARASILADLHELIEREQGWRDTDGLVPARFEQAFGLMDASGGWPAVSITLTDGRQVSFGGLLDRIDVDKATRRALIIDYKTGGTTAYRDLKHDPVAGGRRLQLAVYSQALRNAIRERGEDETAWDVSAEFRFVTARGGFERISVTDGPDLAERLGQVLQWVADGVASGAFPSVPGARDRGSFENCRYCDYDRVCHTARDQVWERKSAELPVLDARVDADLLTPDGMPS